MEHKPKIANTSEMATGSSFTLSCKQKVISIQNQLTSEPDILYIFFIVKTSQNTHAEYKSLILTITKV